MLWLSGALGLLLLGLSAWFCWQLVVFQVRSGTTSYALQLPAWYYTVGLPFAFLLVAARFLQHLVELTKGMANAPGHDA